MTTASTHKQRANRIEYKLLGLRTGGVGTSRIDRPHLPTEMPGALDLTKFTLRFALYVATFSPHGRWQRQGCSQNTQDSNPPGCTDGHRQKQEYNCGLLVLEPARTRAASQGSQPGAASQGQPARGDQAARQEAGPHKFCEHSCLQTVADRSRHRADGNGAFATGASQRHPSSKPGAASQGQPAKQPSKKLGPRILRTFLPADPI